jgi:hypothetical protein
MLFEITAYKLLGNKRKRIYSLQIEARDGINALERSNVRFDSSRLIEIRQIENPAGFVRQERPRVKRVTRDGA